VPRTSLDRVVGPGRNLALIRSDIDLVKKIAHEHGVKVNDVLLEITAGGLRGLLRHRGEPVENLVLPVYVPITLRQPQARAQARGNLIAQIVVPLPIGVPDPGRRLAQIAAATATRRASSHPSLGAAFRSRTARRVLLKVLDRYPVNVTTADVPGPQTPLYLAGAQLLEVFPVLPLISNVSLGVGALSYAGQFNIMAIADQTPAPTSTSSPPAPKTNCRHLPRPPGPGQIAASSAEDLRGRQRRSCNTCPRYPTVAPSQHPQPEALRAGDAICSPVLSLQSAASQTAPAARSEQRSVTGDTLRSRPPNGRGRLAPIAAGPRTRKTT
jgi:hypothetical protein